MMNETQIRALQDYINGSTSAPGEIQAHDSNTNSNISSSAAPSDASLTVPVNPGDSLTNVGHPQNVEESTAAHSTDLLDSLDHYQSEHVNIGGSDARSGEDDSLSLIYVAEYPGQTNRNLHNTLDATNQVHMHTENLASTRHTFPPPMAHTSTASQPPVLKFSNAPAQFKDQYTHASHFETTPISTFHQKVPRNSIAGPMYQTSAAVLPVLPTPVPKPSIDEQFARSNSGGSYPDSGILNQAVENGLKRFDPLTTELEHKSVEAAREYLYRRSPEACQPINLANDDWEHVKKYYFHHLCVELLNAIVTPPANPPTTLTEKEKNTYRFSQARAFSTLEREMSSPDQITSAKARVMLAMHEVVCVHEFGIPKAVFDRVDAKTHRGYQPELNLTCVARACKVIASARDNKLIALDILKGTNIDGLAQAPNKCVERKIANFKTNAARRTKKKGARQSEEDEYKSKDPNSKEQQPDLNYFPSTAPTGLDAGVPLSANSNSAIRPMPQPRLIKPASGFHSSTNGQIHTVTSAPAMYAGAVGTRRRTYDAENDPWMHHGPANKRPRSGENQEDDWTI